MALRRKTTSVRTRLTLWSMAVLAVVLAGFAALVHYSVRAVLLSSVDRDLLREANTSIFVHGFTKAGSKQIDIDEMVSKKALAFRSGVRGTERVTVKLDRVPRDLPDLLKSRGSERRQFMVIRTMDLSGRDISGFTATGTASETASGGELRVPINLRKFVDPKLFGDASSGRQEFATVVADNHPLRVLSKPLKTDGQITGVVQVAYPLDELRNLLRSLDLTLLGLIPVALLVTGIGGTVMTRRALLPVRRISQAAAELEASDLSKRLPVTGNDEFSELATTFNSTFDRLEKAFGQLEEAVEDQRRFTADASHELRTPLTTIKANVSWALRKDRPANEYREALAAADEAADRMNRIVGDLLCLARADNGKLDLNLEAVAVCGLIERIVPRQNHAISGSAVVAPQIVVEPIEPSLFVNGDSHHLLRLLSNLIDNSIRHTPADGKIRITASSYGDAVLIAVEDTGEGIPPEHLPRVTERFYRVDASRSRPSGGVGLGLPICKSIAEAHGGKLDINSEVGKGTKVTVSLPRCRTPR